ncbi:unnamed protein product [Urochloa decumbens]|uniref:F-box domain-containing protein n=1 Tax=Urochloa decumbens TaxID=240449 RepID=A0ABC9AJC2_9POAL
MAADEGFNNVPTDSLVEILLRLPTSARRRFRLVCKRWRDTIDERTPEPEVRTKILVFISQCPRSRAIVLDDDKDGCYGHEWTYSSSTSTGVVHMAVALPPPPVAWDSLMRLGLYGFGYHPVTGRYKIVRVPTILARRRRDAVHVLTLGGSDPAAWREVVSPAMAGSYNASCGIVGVDGSVYWFTSRADRVMALDLADERITSFRGPPEVGLVGGMGKPRPRGSLRPSTRGCNADLLDPVSAHHLRARLGVAVPCYEQAAMTVEVWVLDGGREQPRWSQRYSLIESGDPRNGIVFTPHLTHGEHVLSTSPDRKRLYRRKVGGGGTDVEDRSTAPLRPSEGAELIMMSEETKGSGLLPTSRLGSHCQERDRTRQRPAATGSTRRVCVS